jgi:hypothetical protein
MGRDWPLMPITRELSAAESDGIIWPDTLTGTFPTDSGAGERVSGLIRIFRLICQSD